MHMKCLDCYYRCGTAHNLLFHYKTEHKDKVSECACGNQTKSVNCVEEISSKLKGTTSKCSISNSSSSSSSIFSSSSSSNPNSVSNSNSNSSSNPNSNPKSNSIPDTIPNHNPKNLRSSFTYSHIETKFDITNKICNRSGVIKQITCFD